MTETPSARITRRNFLQILLATGAGVLATGVLQALKSSVPISTPIKNIIFFTQENHSFDSLFAGFPGANSKNAGQRCTDFCRRILHTTTPMHFSQMEQRPQRRVAPIKNLMRPTIGRLRAPLPYAITTSAMCAALRIQIF